MRPRAQITSIAVVSCLLFAPAGAAAGASRVTVTVPATVHAQTLGGYDPLTHEVIPLILQPGSSFFIAYSVTNPNDFPVSFDSITFDVTSPELPSCADFVFPGAQEDLTALPRPLAAHQTQQPLADNHEWFVSGAMTNECMDVVFVFTPHPVATATRTEPEQPSKPGEVERPRPPRPAPVTPAIRVPVTG